MIQVFHLNVTYVAMAIYACCKRMFHVVSLCFMLQAYVFSVLGVLHVCFKCFIRMLQKYLDAT
jgi:hypothetical protein